MALVSGGTTVAIRMDRIDLRELIDGDPIIQNAFTQQIDKGSGVNVTWRGIAFAYGGPSEEFGYVDRLIRGTVFSIIQTSGNETLFSVTGLNTQLTKQFSQDVRAASNTAALGKIFDKDDTMQGTGFSDYLRSFGGHDNLVGGEGSDTLLGGTGNDHLYGQSANGGVDGNDSIAGEDGGDYLQGNAGNDTLDGGIGDDRIQGGQGNDLIRGGTGNDTVNGNLGNDTIEGGNGNDSLRGGQGNDSITAGSGSDTLSGDLGIDTYRGGTGADVFVFTPGGALISESGIDAIVDFSNGTDKIDLGFDVAAILVVDRQGSVAAAMTQAQAKFDATAGSGEVAAVSVGSDTYLFFAGDGGNVIDSAIRLGSVSNVGAIDVTDFL